MRISDWSSDVCSSDLTDACSLALYYASETRAANCKALGIDTPFETPRIGPVVVTGGNPDLKPETSNSLTLGAILQPSFVPGLDVTVDYWDLDIKIVITQFSYATLIRRCVDAPTIDKDRKSTRLNSSHHCTSRLP